MPRKVIQKKKYETLVQGMQYQNSSFLVPVTKIIDGRHGFKKAMEIIHEDDPLFVAHPDNITYKSELYTMSLEDFFKYATPQGTGEIEHPFTSAGPVPVEFEDCIEDVDAAPIPYNGMGEITD